MMLYGRFEHNMDAKGRIFVPVKLREKLGETFIAACVLDKCVSLYSMEEWDGLLQKIAEAPMAETRKLLRKVTESAEDVTPDAQGRILLNKNLIAKAGLEKPCLIIGSSLFITVLMMFSTASDSTGTFLSCKKVSEPR